MNILLIDNGSIHINQLRELLKEHSVTVQNLDSNFSVNQIINLIILSGGHQFSVKNHPRHYQKEISFILENNIPLLGICLGAELIAHSFGAELEMLESKEKGIVQIKIIQDCPLFEDVKDLQVYECHKWTIKTLSKKLIGLAQSKDGYEIIKHKELSIYGFQFHPELFVNQTCGKKLFTNLLNNLKSVVY